MILKYRKKPVVIEAVQFLDDTQDVCLNFAGNGTRNCFHDFDWESNPILKIKTLEGVMTANIGDWIIKGVSGEFYPCKPDIFEKTYEEI